MAKCSVCLTEVGNKTRCPICGNHIINESTSQITRNSNELSNEELMEKVKKSVTKIYVEYLGKEGYAHGSGWHGYQDLIITNAHVVVAEKGEIINNILCEFDPDLKLKNNIIAMVPIYVSVTEDIAILKPLKDKVPAEVPVLKISDKPARQGEDVFTIGSPLDYDFVCMNGIVSNPNYKQKGSESLYNYLQTSLLLNKGNSGGAVFNRKAEVLGMATFGEKQDDISDGAIISDQGIFKGKIVTTKTINGYGFCVKSEAILAALDIAIKRL